jgi:hypothetical protein
MEFFDMARKAFTKSLGMMLPRMNFKKRFRKSND